MTNKVNILYTRKSTPGEKTQVHSHEDQERDLRAVWTRNNDVIEKHFKDSKSAKIPYIREGFTEMMKYIYSNDVKNLYIWDISRGARNMIEGGMLIEALQTGKIERIITNERTFDSNENVLVIAMEFGIAKEYIKKLQQGVKRGHDSKIAKGQPPQYAPIGYLNDKHNLKGDKEILVDPDRFSKVRMLWDAALTGKFSYMDLVRYCNDTLHLVPKVRKNGATEMTKSTLIRLLTNPFYAGRYYRKGELISNTKYKPMVSFDEFQKVQELMKREGRDRNHKHINKYNGLIKCGICGFSVTPEPFKQKLIKSTGEIAL